LVLLVIVLIEFLRPVLEAGFEIGLLEDRTRSFPASASLEKKKKKLIFYFILFYFW